MQRSENSSVTLNICPRLFNFITNSLSLQGLKALKRRPPTRDQENPQRSSRNTKDMILNPTHQNPKDQSSGTEIGIDFRHVQVKNKDEVPPQKRTISVEGNPAGGDINHRKVAIAAQETGEVKEKKPIDINEKSDAFIRQKLEALRRTHSLEKH